MKTVFSAENDAHVKDTEFYRSYPKIQANYKWDRLEPFLSPAVRSYVLPFIGRAFHNELVAVVDREPEHDFSDELVEATELLQRALAYYTVRDMLPEHLANISELGFQAMNDREGTSRTARQWIYYTNLRNLTLKADQYFDQFINFLEERVHLGDADFDSYKNSTERDFKTSLLFRSTKQLNEYLNIQGSRRAYVTIIPYFVKAEARDLTPVLGLDLMRELEIWMSAGNLTPLQEQVTGACRRYIAERGLLAAIPHLSLVVSADGFQIVSNTDGFNVNNSSGLVNSQAAILRLRQDAEMRSGGALQDLRRVLSTNAAALAEFGYTAPETPSTTTNIHDTPGAVGIF